MVFTARVQSEIHERHTNFIVQFRNSSSPGMMLKMEVKQRADKNQAWLYETLYSGQKNVQSGSELLESPFGQEAVLEKVANQIGKHIMAGWVIKSVHTYKE